MWLPSGGSLVIDTTEAMTVIDVNTGKFTGQGGNLEQTVTRNNLEAAEEIVRQLRVRDVGGIIVIDFIDMVLESNRDLVLRRLLECLARDRTKHQVAEVTSLGLVQMTRKRVGSGLLEAFSVPCDCCNGRGVIVSLDPVDHAPVPSADRPARDGGRGGASRGGASRRAGRGSPGGKAAAQSGDVTETSAAPKPPESADGEQAGRIPAQGAAAHADVPDGGVPASAVGEAVTDGAASEAGTGGDAAAGDGAGSRQVPGRRRRRASARAAGPPDSADALDAGGSPVAVEAPGTAGAPGAVAADGAPGADAQGGGGGAQDSAAQHVAAQDLSLIHI